MRLKLASRGERWWFISAHVLALAIGLFMCYAALEHNPQEEFCTYVQAGAFALAYDETGMRTLLAYPNGLQTHSTHDVRDRVLSLITTGEKSTSPSDQAPDFTLPAATGKTEVKLSSFRGRKPVVLIFGSYT